MKKNRALDNLKAYITEAVYEMCSTDWDQFRGDHDAYRRDMTEDLLKKAKTYTRVVVNRKGKHQ